MILLRQLRSGLVVLLGGCLACPPTRALVALNDGRERIYVTGSFSVGHDSNVFANRNQESDVVYGSSLTAEYTRRAGLIGVNGAVAVSGSSFGRHKDQDFSNPSYNLEFTKQSGRTTGSLSFNAARESRADAAVNLRSTSWNYGTGLDVKYPAGINTLVGQFGYSNRTYVEDTVFADLATYNAAVDLIHLLPGERELITGYRHRFSESSARTSTTDHSATVGIGGRLMRGVSGDIRGGWQTRVPRGFPAGQGSFSSWTLSGRTNYVFSKRLNISLQLAKDFATTATDSSVDVTNADVQAGYTLNSKVSLSFAGGWGTTRFLGEGNSTVVGPGVTVILGEQRFDTYANWSTGLSYDLHEHLKAGLNYTWFQNWSTSAFADFVRTSWSLNLSSRW